MPHWGKVFDHFNNHLTAELAKAGCKSLLYIGWRDGCSPWWHSTFIQDLGIPFENCAVLEIYEGNFNQARSRFKTAIHGDARKADELFVPGQFDMIFWDHGPEHVSQDDLKECTPKLMALAGKVLLYCCPWGDWPQGPEGGNQHEMHYTVDDGSLESLGMKLVKFGAPGQNNNGELIAYFVKP